jgi:hypothetical protein
VREHLAHSRRGRGHLEGASIWAKIGRIVYGAERDQVHPMYFEDRHLDTMDFVRDAFRDTLLQGSVFGGRGVTGIGGRLGS